MQSLNLFYKNACKLSKSLVIKFNQLITNMELGKDVFNPNIGIGNIGYDDPRLRFYRHIQGELYEGIQYININTKPDEPVMIKVIETEKVEPLTKELLKVYRLTKSELLKMEDFYQSLIDEYPTMRLYIHGCLWPVEDIEKVIEAEEGTIISYNSKFIEYNEYELMRDLESYIKKVHSRWNIQPYGIVDEYYFISFLGVLFSQLPGKIVALRTDKIDTPQAHSFFLECYFDSRFELWDAISKLDKETQWWLYNNMDYIIKNIGKNSTLEIILRRVMEPNYVGVGGYILASKDPALQDSSFDPTKLPFEDRHSIIDIVPLNGAYSNTKARDILETRTVVNEQFKLTNQYTEGQEEYVGNKIVQTMDTYTVGRNLTKTLTLSTLSDFKGHNIDTLRVLMDYWAYFLHMGYFGSFTDLDNSTPKREFVDPNTGEKYFVNSRTGFLIILKLMLNAAKYPIDKPIKKYIVSTVFDSEAKLEYIFSHILYDDGLTSYFTKELIDRYPFVFDKFASLLDTGEFLNKVLEYCKDLWKMASNAESAFVAANFRNFMYLTSLQQECLIHDKEHDLTIDELLEEESITFKIYGNYNPTKSIFELIKVCLNVEIDVEGKLSRLVTAYKEIINKLTTYTTHVLGGSDTSSSNFVFYNTLNFIRMKRGLLSMDERYVSGKAVNDTDTTSIFFPYDNKEDPTVYDMTPLASHGAFRHNQIRGGLIIDPREITVRTNQASVDLLPLPSKRMNEVDLKDPDMVRPTLELVGGFLYINANGPLLSLQDSTVEDYKNMLGNMMADSTTLIDPNDVDNQRDKTDFRDKLTNTAPASVKLEVADED